MGNVFKLISKTNSSKNWGAKDVLDEAQKDLSNGDIPADSRMIVVYATPYSKDFTSGFIQCGMTASEMIMLLELAKMDIYKKFMGNAE